MKTIVLIPSRLSATRLPGKPLLKINGISIISHVFKKAQDANIGDVYVATENEEILDDVKKNGGQGILTSKKHKTGTDRIYEAFKNLGEKNIELIMNLQGDEPLMNLNDIQNLHKLMIKKKFPLGTLASKINDNGLYEKKSIVKVVTENNLNNSNFPKAINFFRTSSKKFENVYHHLGIYCYNVETIKKFVSLKQSHNEIKNNLEQLRAIDNDININVALAESSPIGVDTQEDFVAVKKIMEYKS